LERLCPFAREAGVGLWVESNGVWADTARLGRLLSSLRSAALGAVWDIHHPFRYFGEGVEAVLANIGPYIRHVHIKDSVMQGGMLTYKMLGYGDLPLADAVGALKASGYGGFVSVEWVKRWNEELEDGGVALPHAIYSIRKLLDG
jgi:fatty-acyl-CoA synthase